MAKFNVHKIKYRTNYFFRVLLILAITFFAISPFILGLLTSLKEPVDLLAIPIIWFPKVPQWQSFIRVFELLPMFTYLKNSLILAFSTASLTAIISTMGGYALARLGFKGARVLFVTLLVSYMLPWIVLLIPFYFMLLALDLNNTLIGLILVYCTFSIPFSTLLMRNYILAAYPKELEESASLDGANLFQIFIRITLPLSLPGISAVLLFAFIIAWNDYMYASVLISDKALKTIQTGIYAFVGRGGTVSTNLINVAFAAGTLIVIPVIIAAFFIQKNIVKGLGFGGIKG